MGENTLRVRLDLASPDDKDLPSGGPEGGLIGSVAGDITVEFEVPELGVSLRAPAALSAVVTVPETAVDENDRPIAR